MKEQRSCLKLKEKFIFIISVSNLILKSSENWKEFVAGCTAVKILLFFSCSALAIYYVYKDEVSVLWN
jgi:hypothetical protein